MVTLHCILPLAVFSIKFSSPQGSDSQFKANNKPLCNWGDLYPPRFEEILILLTCWKVTQLSAMNLWSTDVRERAGEKALVKTNRTSGWRTEICNGFSLSQAPLHNLWWSLMILGLKPSCWSHCQYFLHIIVIMKATVKQKKMKRKIKTTSLRKFATYSIYKGNSWTLQLDIHFFNN